MFMVRLYDETPGRGEVLLEEHEYAQEDEAREITRTLMRDGYARVTLTKPGGYHRNLTEDEQTRLYMVPWPQRLAVAEQIGAERAEAKAKAEQAEADRKMADWMTWVRWTEAKAAEEARNHRAGLACDSRYCGECAAEINRDALRYR